MACVLQGLLSGYVWELCQCVVQVHCVSQMRECSSVCLAGKPMVFLINHQSPPAFHNSLQAPSSALSLPQRHRSPHRLSPSWFCVSVCLSLCVGKCFSVRVPLSVTPDVSKCVSSCLSLSLCLFLPFNHPWSVSLSLILFLPASSPNHSWSSRKQI